MIHLRKARAASQQEVSLNDLCNTAVTGFLQFLQEAEEFEKNTKNQGLVWRIADWGERLKDISLDKTYEFFGGLACSVLQAKYQEYHNFLTGVIGLTLVPVDQFLRREAVPRSDKGQGAFDWPKGFGMQTFFAVYLANVSTKKHLKFLSGEVPMASSCLLFEAVPLVDAVLTLSEQMSGAKDKKTLGQSFQACEKPQEFKQASSEHLPFLDSALDSIPKMLQMTTAFQKRILDPQWKDLSKSDHEDAVSETDEALTVLAKIAEDNSEGPMSVLLNLQLEGLSSGNPSGRLQQPEDHFRALSETAADLVYLMCSRMTTLESFVAKLGQKLADCMLKANAALNTESNKQDKYGMAVENLLRM